MRHCNAAVPRAHRILRQSWPILCSKACDPPSCFVLSPPAPGLDGGSAAIDGEFRALDEARAISRQEHDGFGNLVGGGGTPCRRLGGQSLKTLAQCVGAFSARGAGTDGIDAHPARAI